MSPLPYADPKQPATPAPKKSENAANPAELPAEELACRRRLAQRGVAFDPRPTPPDASGGCSLPYPIAVTGLGNGVVLNPEALLNCQIAEAAAKFVSEETAKFAAQEFPGRTLTAVEQVSGYVCRVRNGSSKLSEHALGNALDIAAFTLSDGTRIDVAATRNPQHSRFLSHVRTAACGPFKTVLGPGSNADHATHFHFDLDQRRNGGTVCD
ncbi:extensin-like domain-containing protein [Mesorhizobium sp. NBSH29]|uniref:extensin-like domain-containing protein n=1 Tax=Mesorhizobium sp. NBSH29 TaxID=2654249 RepID=UPI001896A13B|nr:extensin family protein [Mesorhizobium sp. NBSH29]